MKTLLKIIARLLLAAIFIAAVGIGVLTAAEYRPAATEDVEIAGGSGARTPQPGETLRVVSWNIGYGALGDNADFFMDGGSGVRTADRARVEQNLSDIASGIASLEPDILLLQEADRGSDRSWRIDETAFFAGLYPDAAACFAPNYRALYVPYPLPPIGHVDSGLLTLSSAAVASAQRISLPCPFAWPIRTVNLKRCLLVTRIPVEGGRELVLVNLHLEAYDDGEGKVAQTRQLSEFLAAEAEQGNYVIAGGDFNQIFSGVDSGLTVREGLWAPGAVDAGAFDERFTLLMDPSVPSCRSLDRPLAGADPADFQYYLIDGFIVSDNLTVTRLETVDMGFAATDHNPVVLEVTLGE